MPRIFVSHAAGDGARLASDLVAELEKGGRSCWIAPRDVAPGATYPAQIMAALRECEGLVLLLTAGANASVDVLQEVKIAHGFGKKIVPMIVAGTVPSDDLAYFLAVRHHVPWSGPDAIAALVATAVPVVPPNPVSAMPAAGALDPLAAIAAAASEPNGMTGKFKLQVRRAALEGDEAWLCSEMDYRDPRCLSVRLEARARQQCLAVHGAEPPEVFMGKPILVTGIAKQRRIDFLSDGTPTGHYYYQTHIDIDEIEKIALA